MVVFIEAVAERWHWVAAICVVAAVYYLRRLRWAHIQARDSIFGLEREQAALAERRYFSRSVLLVFLAFFSYALRFHILPLLPEPERRVAEAQSISFPPTATPTQTATPFIEYVAEEEQPLPTAEPLRTVTPPPSPTPVEPTATPTPGVAAVQGCTVQGVLITSPAPGAAVSGVVTVSGVADIPNFQFYKIEVAGGEATGDWSVIGELQRNPVSGGVLGLWDTGPFPAGPYWVRLVVVDNTGNYPVPCAIRVTLVK
jgi:hypothetical protein